MADETKSPHQIAKQTIRLKPIAPSSSAGLKIPTPVQPAAPALKPVAAPTVKPVSVVPSPSDRTIVAENPADAPTLNMTRPEIPKAPAQSAAPTVAAPQPIKPATPPPVKELARRTIKLVPPVKVPAAPSAPATTVAAPAVKPIPAAPTPSDRTIVTEATTDAPTINMTRPEIPKAPAAATRSENEITQKTINISRKTIRISPPPTAGQLPSLGKTPAAAPVPANNKPTLSITPPAPAPTPAETASEAPKAPVLKLNRKQEAAPDAKTINIAQPAAAPDARTITLDTQTEEAEEAKAKKEEKAVPAPAPAVPEASETPEMPTPASGSADEASKDLEIIEPVKEEPAADHSNPGPVFTGLSIAALLVILLSIYVLVTQFVPTLPLPGLK